MDGGTLDAKPYDRSKLKVKVLGDVSTSSVNWTKWGSVASIAAVILAGIALWAMFYLDKN
jgi:hypothetical protein